MDFGDVIKALKADPERRFARESWQRPGRRTAYIGMQPPEGTPEEVAYIFIVGVDGRMPFVPGINSVIADDWYEVERWTSAMSSERSRGTP